MTRTTTGLMELINDNKWKNSIKGNIGYLCHSASVDDNYEIGITHLKKIFSDRLIKLFGPQHGLVTDVQDNMIESSNFTHPYFKLPVYSLYSDTRIPTPEMLEGIDTLIIDLQDVGCRIYTYITTMAYAMEACGKQDIDVVVLDRPNPIGGDIIEGNIREEEFQSFVGHHPIPVRHGMTMGEIARFSQLYCNTQCNLTVIPMNGWQRNMFFEDTKLPWVLPSPNLPTVDAAFPFVATVLFEGTNISEGRGTTRSLEIIGHPKIKPFELLEVLLRELKKTDLEGFILRPLYYMPTFQKHAEISCGGYQIHVVDRLKFRPWKLGQFLCQFLYKHLGADFLWKSPPYEYENDILPIDVINGSDKIRKWVESLGSFEELISLEQKQMDLFLSNRSNCLLYR